MELMLKCKNSELEFGNRFKSREAKVIDLFSPIQLPTILIVEAKVKMENILVWFCGTGTDHKKQQQEFQSAIANYDYTFFIPGVGTDEMKKYVKTLNDEDGFWKKFKFWKSKKTRGTTTSMIQGYQEEEHLIGSMTIFKVLETISNLPGDVDVELTIGGHSRGAAVGLMGFLTTLLAAAEFDNNSQLWTRVSNIRIIAVDPVQGRQEESEDTNDMMGLPSHWSVDRVINSIEELLFEGKSVFKVIVYTARFDAREQFRLDYRWEQWIETNKDSLLQNQSSAELYIAGFRHSSMVCAEDEISEVYDRNFTPLGLMKQILKADTDTGRRDREVYYTTLSNKEISLLQDLKKNPNRQELCALVKNTNLQSYDWGRMLAWLKQYTGSSLKDLVAEQELKPDFKYARRYVFYKRSFVRRSH